jgi:hypothetical protein
MNIVNFLRNLSRKAPTPTPMGIVRDNAASSLIRSPSSNRQINQIGALDQFEGPSPAQSNVPLTPQELDELLYGNFTPPMTAAERARLMEMQNPAGDYDDVGVMSLEELKRNPEISRPQRTSVFYDE